MADDFYAEEDEAVRISYSPGYSGPAGGGRRAMEEAVAALQGHLDSLETIDVYGYGKKINSAREIDLGDEKMGLQGFEVYGDEGYTGRFVIGKGGAILNLDNCRIPEHVSEEDCWNMYPVKIDDHTIHLYGADLVAGHMGVLVISLFRPFLPAT